MSGTVDGLGQCQRQRRGQPRRALCGRRLIGSDTTSPYQIAWNTTTATNGGHGLQTRAFDAAGNVGSSAAVNVTVSNGHGGGGELIVNGGFEGSATPWTLSGNAYWSNGGNQHSGTGYTVLGFYNNANGTEYQTVTIPAGHPANLTFWLNITTSESLSTAYDFLFAEVRSTSGALLGTLATYSNRNASALLAEVVQPRRLARADGAGPVPGHDRHQPDDGLPGRRRLAEVGVSAWVGGRAAAHPRPDATIRRCPRPRSRSTSSSRRSEPSSPGFVITFDPDAVASRVAELDRSWGSPASGTTRPARPPSRPSTPASQAPRAVRTAPERVRRRQPSGSPMGSSSSRQRTAPSPW